MNGVAGLVMTNRLLNCLIGSTLLHAALFVLITRTPPTAHTEATVVDAFLVESAAPRIPGAKRLPDPRADRPRALPEPGKVQPARQVETPHLPDLHAAMAASTSDKVPPATQQQPAPGRSIATAAPGRSIATAAAGRSIATAAPGRSIATAAAGSGPIGASITPLPDGSREEKNRGSASVSTRTGPGPAQIMVLGEVGAPRFISREAPAYPSVARKLGKEGKVVLRLALDAQGRLQGVEVVEANGFGFAESAGAAIRKSTFAPAVRGGKTVASQVLVPVRFVLHEGQ